MDRFHYFRPELAAKLADALLGRSFANYRSGLFLAAPRRTGKSTFLRQELTPCLEAQGVKVVYVDLWEDRRRDPADLIKARLLDATKDVSGWVAKFAGKAAPKSIRLPGIAQIDFKDKSQTDHASMTEILSGLANLARSHIALVIDEAQHALSSEEGRNAMFALKAARDAFSQTTTGNEASRLILLFTGSDRLRLSQLMNRNDAPFFGATLEDFPLLDVGYCAEYANRVNPRLAADQQLDVTVLHQVFVRLGSRPELLSNIVNACVEGPGTGALVAMADAKLAELDGEYAAAWDELEPTEQAILSHMAREAANFRPYTANTYKAVGDIIGEAVSQSKMQTGINRLLDAAILWSPGRGRYDFQDQGFGAWIRAFDEG